MPVVLARSYRGRASLQSAALAFSARAVHERGDRAVATDRRIRPGCRGGNSRAAGKTGDIRKRSTREAAMGSFLTMDRMSVEGQPRRLGGEPVISGTPASDISLHCAK